MILSVLISFLAFTVIQPDNQYFKSDFEKTESLIIKRKLIVFSGSDWCKNCIQLKKQVLSSEVFIEFAKESIEIVTADFPQREKLPKEEVAKNEALAEKYNPEGEFPKLILLSADGSSAKVIQYANQSPQEFVAELKNYLAH